MMMYVGANKTDRNRATHGIGDEDLILFAMEEKHHQVIRATKQKLENEKRPLRSDLASPNPWPKINKASKEAGSLPPEYYARATELAFKSLEHNATAPYDNTYEWRITPQNLKHIVNKTVDPASLADHRQSTRWRKIKTKDLQTTAHESHHAARKSHLQANRLNFHNTHRQKATGTETCSDKELLDLIITQTDSPLLIFTDGGSQAKEHHKGAANAAAITLCIADIRQGESLITNEWQDRPPIPVLTRISVLPDNMGTTPLQTTDTPK